MFCHKCGNKSLEGAGSCQKCGHFLSQGEGSNPNAGNVVAMPPFTNQSRHPNKKKFFILAGAVALAVVIAVAIMNSSSGNRGASLAGTWDWEGMHGAIVLRTDGGYSWLGTDYGSMGYRWSSENGSVISTSGNHTIAWFKYQFIDNNTLRIEYYDEPGVFYTVRRAR